MQTTTYPFKSEEDGMYYYWLRDMLHGPYDTVEQAIERLQERVIGEEEDS